MSAGWRDPFSKESKEPFKPNPKSLDGVPDLCMLTYLGEDNVLHNLGYRYKEGKIYTSTTSKVLIAVNPYERMDAIYTSEMMGKYQSAEINLEGIQGEKDLPPHVYTVSNSAYQNMIAKKQNQSIIVCGESGSGKTESAKYQMRFLAFTTTSGAKDKSEFEAADKVGQQVLDANPILESFGNAKTLLNNNSSRFGKFTKMLFDEVKAQTGQKPRRRLIGAIIETYLLEKSRVVKQDKGERNFHVFYQLTFHHKGHTDLPDLKLGPVESFHYTNQSGVSTLDDLRFPGKTADGEWFKELMDAFKTLNIPRSETDDVFKIVSGVLHLGNINFEQLSGEGSEIKEKDTLAIAADMFQIPLAGLEKRLKTRSILLPGDKLLVKPLNEPDAVFNRDSCSRNLYNGLFRWIVSRINKQSSVSEGPGTTWIGILDVFGFEIFEHNSFEQFCINFANERLQQYFNEHVLKAEQDLYKREALLWDPIDLPDNQDCIDLVTSKPYGIIPILDSTCVQPKGTDTVFTANLFKAHKYHPRLREVKQHKKSESDKQYTAMNGFVIRHYAGTVLYDCEQFLIKNADASEFDTVELFMESKSQIASELLRITADGRIEDGKRSTKRSFRSTGGVFTEQLDSLMKTLKQTAPYFVRCIKPNLAKAPKNFEGEYVRPQLRCGGLIEALRIIKLGFPTRCAYKRVHELFQSILKDQKPMPNLNIRDFTEAIMSVCGDQTKKVHKGDYQLGLSMVFFRPGCQTYLTDILEKKPEAVTPPQRIAIRKFMVKKRWIRGRGTVRALNICGKMLNEMRFKKAAVAMVLLYRAVGRALKQARYSIGGKKEEAEKEKKQRDEAFQAALRAAEELKKATQQKAEMEAALRKQAEDNQRSLVEKEAQVSKLESRLEEFNDKIRASEEKSIDFQRKQNKLYEDSKTKASELQSKMIDVGAEKDRAAAQVRSLEGQIAGKNSDLANKEKQIADKNQTVATLQQETANLREEIQKVTENGEVSVATKIKEMQDMQATFEADKDQLEGTIKDREADIEKLRISLAEQEKKLVLARDHADNKEKAFESKSQDYERQIADAQRQIEELKSEVENYKKRLEEAKNQSETAARIASESLKQIRHEAQEEKTRLERILGEKEAELSQLNADLAVLRSQTESQNKAAIEGLQQEREESRQRAERQDKVLAETDGALNTVKRDLALASGKLEAALAASAELTARSSAQLEEYDKKIQELSEKQERDVRRLENKLIEGQTELSLFKERLDDTNRELKVSIQVNDEIRSDSERQLKDKDGILADQKAELRKAQAKYDQVVQSAAEKAALLQEQLNSKRTQERESQVQFDKQIREKNRELMEVRSEVELLKNRLSVERDRAESDRKLLEGQIEQAKSEALSKIQKLELEIAVQIEDIEELKSDFKADKKEWSDKQERYEKQVSDLEKVHQTKQDQIKYQLNKIAGLEKSSKATSEEAAADFKRKEEKYQAELEELKATEKELEEQVTSLQSQKISVLQEIEKEKQALRDTERKHREELLKKRAEIDRLEKEFLSYKGEVGATNESKTQALLGQAQTLKSVLDDEKREKEEAKKRELDYRARLKEASSQLSDAMSELKHVQATHDIKLEKLRVELEIAREKNTVESQAWKEQSDTYERQIIEKSRLITELKAEISELTEREASATKNLKQRSSRVTDEYRKLKAKNDSLESDKKKWLEKQSDYESRLTKAEVELAEVQTSLAEAELDGEAALQDLKTEVGVVKAQLEAEKRSQQERESDFEKELRLHKARFAKELQRLKSNLNRTTRNRPKPLPAIRVAKKLV